MFPYKYAKKALVLRKYEKKQIKYFLFCILARFQSVVHAWNFQLSYVVMLHFSILAHSPRIMSALVRVKPSRKMLAANWKPSADLCETSRQKSILSFRPPVLITALSTWEILFWHLSDSRLKSHSRGTRSYKCVNWPPLTSRWSSEISEATQPSFVIYSEISERTPHVLAAPPESLRAHYKQKVVFFRWRKQKLFRALWIICWM